jgi:hypothetical protein
VIVAHSDVVHSRHSRPHLFQPNPAESRWNQLERENARMPRKQANEPVLNGGNSLKE